MFILDIILVLMDFFVKCMVDFNGVDFKKFYSWCFISVEYFFVGVCDQLCYVIIYCNFIYLLKKKYDQCVNFLISNVMFIFFMWFYMFLVVVVCFMNIL